jgi:hypothetical protein
MIAFEVYVNKLKVCTAGLGEFRWIDLLGIHDTNLDAIADEQVVMDPSVRLLSIDAADREHDLVLVRPAIRINSTHQRSDDGVELTCPGGSCAV